MDRDELFRVLSAFEKAGLEYTLIARRHAHALYRLKNNTVRALDRHDAAMLRERFHLNEGD